MTAIKTFFLVLLMIFSYSCKPDLSDRRNPEIPIVEPTEVKPSVDPNLAKDERLTWQKPEEVIAKLGKIDTKTIADLGAGIGYFSFKLLPKSEKVIAIDIDPQTVQILNGFKQSLDEGMADRFDVRLATPTDSKLQDNEVDVVFIVNTITYIENRKEYLAKLKDKLTDTGQIFIVDFKMKKLPAFTNAPAISDRAYMHLLEAQLAELGFEDIEVDDTTLDYQFIITAYK